MDNVLQWGSGFDFAPGTSSYLIESRDKSISIGSGYAFPILKSPPFYWIAFVIILEIFGTSIMNSGG